MSVVVLIGYLMALLRFTDGRARLLEPPMRSSYWREGVPSAAANYDDELLNCGGFEPYFPAVRAVSVADGWRQVWRVWDAVDGFRENEYPGKYSQFSPLRTYFTGTYINATVYSRPNMLGWFEFRLCTRRDGPDVPDLQKCLDEHVLQIEETGMTRYYPGSLGGYSDMHVLLPPGVSCDHCILQWKYNTGYRNTREKTTCSDCLGCGPQEQYYNCADIRIASSKDNATATPMQTTPAQHPVPTTSVPAQKPTPPTGGTVPSTPDPSSLEACTPSAKLVQCEAKGMHRLVPGMGDWCLKNCQSGKCREEFCSCFCQYPEGYKILIDPVVFNRVMASPSLSIGIPSSTIQKRLCYKPQDTWNHTPGMEGWCQMFCPGRWCADMCQLRIC
ncbi:uncharacterized protein LOC112555337 [Pomacea canaliculata]|uniref:uncharacterized protein LOC112555337 n=1 Tax=Pomacea canaliculata TaxID=400727 RepID=UPI000D72742B|nr:uncharacterized protein LOC112555337 [Pomacea canaliculata]